VAVVLGMASLVAATTVEELVLVFFFLSLAQWKNLSRDIVLVLVLVLLLPLLLVLLSLVDVDVGVAVAVVVALLLLLLLLVLLSLGDADEGVEVAVVVALLLLLLLVLLSLVDVDVGVAVAVVALLLLLVLVAVEDLVVVVCAVVIVVVAVVLVVAEAVRGTTRPLVVLVVGGASDSVQVMSTPLTTITLPACWITRSTAPSLKDARTRIESFLLRARPIRVSSNRANTSPWRVAFQFRTFQELPKSSINSPLPCNQRLSTPWPIERNPQ